MGFHFVQRHSLRWISELLGAVLFAACIAAGVELWRGTARGLRWGTVMFALQIPVFTFDRVMYEFSTLLSFRVMAGDTKHLFGGNVGSSSNIYWSGSPIGLLLGMNFVALAAVLLLIRASRAAGTR